MNLKSLGIYSLIFLVISSIDAGGQDRPVTLSGEVTQGQTFRHSVGRGLDFVLDPSNIGSGWTVEISPHDKPPDPQCGDFLWVVTPPYHFQNVRYLDTSYNTTAQQAVHNSPRRFSFVMNCSDFEIERKRVELVIYPSTASKQEVDDALANLPSSPLGKGVLWIEDFRITPSHKTGTAEDLGAIHWIKFKVKITFPAGLSQRDKP